MKKLSLRKLSFALVATLTVALAACAPEETTSAPVETTSADKPATITPVPKKPDDSPAAATASDAKEPLEPRFRLESPSQNGKEAVFTPGQDLLVRGWWAHSAQEPRIEILVGDLSYTPSDVDRTDVALATREYAKHGGYEVTIPAMALENGKSLVVKFDGVTKWSLQLKGDSPPE